MYCYDYIEEAVIDVHLSKCPKRTELSFDSVKALKDSILYIRSFLESIPEISGEYKNQLHLLIVKCSQICECSKEAYTFVKTISESIEGLISHCQGKIYLKLCMQKILSCSKDLLNFMQEPEEDSKKMRNERRSDVTMTGSCLLYTSPSPRDS